MASLTWQQAAGILVLILIGTGTITYTNLFGVLFQLKGINYTNSGDIYCEETCESFINVTTSYWRICFAGYKDTRYENETLFKKDKLSRTLHVNLDNVDNIISTNPRIKVDWLVPARSGWREIKDGDCWERGQVNKIKIKGYKDKTQTVKWGFAVGDYINIDPEWIGKKTASQTNAIKFTEPAYSEEQLNLKIINDNGSVIINTSVFNCIHKVPSIETKDILSVASKIDTKDYNVLISDNKYDFNFSKLVSKTDIKEITEEIVCDKEPVINGCTADFGNVILNLCDVNLDVALSKEYDKGVTTLSTRLTALTNEDFKLRDPDITVLNISVGVNNNTFYNTLQNSTWAGCFQETANSTTDSSNCNVNISGEYNWTGNWTVSQTQFLYDGNHATATNCIGTEYCHLYVNYTKPNEYGGRAILVTDGAWTTNYIKLNESCYAMLPKLQLWINFTPAVLGGGIPKTDYYCFNTTDWYYIGKNQGSNYFEEESIIWLNNGTYTSEVIAINTSAYYNRLNVSMNTYGISGNNVEGAVRTFLSLDSSIVGLWMEYEVGGKWKNYGSGGSALDCTMRPSKATWIVGNTYNSSYGTSGSYNFSGDNPGWRITDTNKVSNLSTFMYCSWTNVTEWHIFWKGNDFKIQVGPTYAIHFPGLSDDWWNPTINGKPPNNGNWTFMCAGYNSSHFIGYRDGTYLMGDATTGTASFSSEFHIGLYAKNNIAMLFLINGTKNETWLDEVYNFTRMTWQPYTDYQSFSSGHDTKTFNISNTSSFAQLKTKKYSNGTEGTIIYSANMTFYVQGEEAGDSTPPSISIAPANITTTNQSILWNVTFNEASNMSGTYGVCPTYSSSYFENSSRLTTLTYYNGTLTNSTTYCFNLTSFCDASNNCNTTGYIFNFTTSGTFVTTEAPVCSINHIVNCTFPNSFVINKTINMSCKCNTTTNSWAQYLNFSDDGDSTGDYWNISIWVNVSVKRMAKPISKSTIYMGAYSFLNISI